MSGRLGIAKVFGDFVSGMFGSEKALPEGGYEVFGLNNGERAYLHRSAALYSPVYTSLTNGERVYVFPPSESLGAEWCRVEYDGVSAWMETQHLRPLHVAAY